MSRTTFSGPVASQNGFSPTVYTSATLPAATSVPSGTILAVDDGGGPALVISNGTVWGAVSAAGTLVLSTSAADAAANWAALEAALSSGTSLVRITAPGLYLIRGQILLSSNQTLEIGPGVTLKRVWRGTAEGGTFLRNRNQPLSNADTTSGNVNIKVFGGGTIDCNCYDPAKNAPVSYYQDGIQFISVTGFVVENIQVANPCKTHFRLSKCSGGLIRDFRVDFDSVGGLNDGNNGKDAIFIAGNCSYIRVKGVTGKTNDDGVTVNTADVPFWSMPFAVGHISDIVIEDVYVDTQFTTPGGGATAMYPECWLDDTSGLGAGQVDPFLGNKPTITAMSVNATTGLVTATTNIPHQLNVGSNIKITGANPAGYNTTNYTDNNGWATVYSVPSTTQFQYWANNATGAYVSGAVLQQSWDMRNIAYKNIRGTRGCKISSFRSTIPVNRAGVARDVKFEDVRNVMPDGQTYTQIGLSDATMVNLTVLDGATSGDKQSPLFDMINGSYLGGVTTFQRGSSISEIRNYSASAQTYICIRLGADQVVVDGFYFRQASDTETTRQPIFVSDDVRMLTVSNCRFYGPRNNFGQLIRTLGGNAKDQIINVRGVWLGGDTSGSDGVQLMSQPSTAGGGRLFLNVTDTHFAGCSSIGMGTMNGTNITISLNNITLNNLGVNGLLFFGTAGQQVEVNVGHINYNSTQRLFASTQAALTGGGVLTVRGINARMDITLANRVDGAVLYNTNAAANNGTDGVIPAGLYFCTGNTVGSWKLAGTTGGANKQY